MNAWNLNTWLELAEKAKKDHKLVKNHILHGVKECLEIELTTIIDMLKINPNTSMKRKLESEFIAINKALSVYRHPWKYHPQHF